MNTPVFNQIIATAPDAARELFAEYRERKDANERVKIKVKIKVLLDILSLDTIMPPLPEPRRQDNRMAVGQANYPMPLQAPRLGDPQHREEIIAHEGVANVNGNAAPLDP